MLPSSFAFEATPEVPEEVCKMFSVTPQKGTLSPVDRPAQVSAWSELHTVISTII